jgi:hypothetical protein
LFCCVPTSGGIGYWLSVICYSLFPKYKETLISLTNIDRLFHWALDAMHRVCIFH